MTSLTPAGIGMLPPSYAMISGQPLAGGVPLGYEIVGENLIVWLLLRPAVMAKVPVLPDFENEAVTTGGLGGRVPAS